MKYPIGKVSFDAKKANGVLFDAGSTALWIQPFWGDPFAISASGKIEWPAQPTRSQVVWASSDRAIFQSNVTTESADGLFNRTELVMLDPQGRALGEPLEVACHPEGSGAYVVHVCSDGRFASVLEHAGDTSVVALWSLETRRAVARHAVPHSAKVLNASAIAGGHAFVVADQALLRFPFDGGAPSATSLDGATYGGAFHALGGAARLPTSLLGDVLIQRPDGALELYASTGACLFRHSEPQTYLVGMRNGAREARRGVAAIAPSGERVVAAVGCEADSGTACLEVFDRAGASVRRLEWKCGKSETTYDVAIDDEGWIALATTHRAEIFAPEGISMKKKSPKKT